MKNKSYFQISKIILFLALFCFSAGISIAYQKRLENWQASSSFYETLAIAIDWQSRIWVATSGGVYSFDTLTKEIKEFRNINALESLDATAIICDSVRKQIIIGSGDGVIDIYSEDKKWFHDLSIKTDRNITNRRINDFLIKDSKLFVATSFGLAIFDLEKKVFRESVFQFGNFQKETNTNKVFIQDNIIWVGTDAGIAVANIDSISNRFSWKNYTTADSLSDNTVLSFASYQNSVYIALKNSFGKIVSGLYVKDRDFSSIYMKSYGNNLFISNLFSLLILPKDELIKIEHPGFISCFDFGGSIDNPLIAIGYSNQGAGYFINGKFTRIPINTPKTNQFTELDIDPKGRLWASTAISTAGAGFESFDSKTWTLFNVEDDKYKQILTNSYFRIKALTDGRIVASSWGTGVLIFEEKADSNIFSNYDTKNSCIKPTLPDHDTYVVMGKAEQDNNGTVWVINFGVKSSPGSVLFSIDKDNNMHCYENRLNPGNRAFLTLAIDRYGTKWLGSEEDGLGLYYFNEMGTPDNPKDDKFDMLTTSNKLISNIQRALAFDKSGWLWIGTVFGVSVLHNPDFVISGFQPIIQKEVFILKGQKINDILVDPLNNKWFATNSGIWILNEDGSDTIATYNTSNSPLATNEILSLALNEQTGTLYIGTRNQLYMASTQSVQPLESYSLNCYPQPFYSGLDKELFIDGLAADSDVRILTSNGEFIRSITTRSKITTWDGRDSSGNLVSSGIYLIVTSSSSTNTSSVGKIAVIRK
ncbi:MAG: putative periplasmic ligand-binding sensor domain protein [Ignavibacteria bacterium]|nr:putative periplasmic ligand-binding sensor domain protein [Ignavibacteria bacterium]